MHPTGYDGAKRDSGALARRAKFISCYTMGSLALQVQTGVGEARNSTEAAKLPLEGASARECIKVFLGRRLGPSLTLLPFGVRKKNTSYVSYYITGRVEEKA